MTMGLRRLDVPQWLSIDPSVYVAEHNVRANMLANHRSTVIACLPGSETACREVLDLVVSFLTTRYPQYFALSGTPNTPSHAIMNHLTNELTPLHPSKVALPLETAARLAQEDFNVLFKSPLDNQYHLLASATLFPAGWKLQERIGGTLGELHGPVPTWSAKLGCPVDRYFDHLKASTPMERHPMFVQTDGDYYKDADLNNRDETASAAAPAQKAVCFDNLYLRRERQTFRRLEKSGAVLFAVHTFMKKMTNVGDDELAALVGIADTWDEGVAGYKARDAWIDAAREGLASRGVPKAMVG